MASELEQAKVYDWNSDYSFDSVDESNYVLIKKGFFGRIKAIVQEIPEYVEVSKYKTVKVKLSELSDSDIITLINYFEGKREKKQIELLKSEIEYRKRKLVNPDEIRPSELNNSLKIKYNITKKVVREKKYGKKVNIKMPKKDFIFLCVKNRELASFDYPSIGISLNIVFNIINPKKYMKKLNKFFKNGFFMENDLFDEIKAKLKKIIDEYLKVKKNLLSNNEDLLLDSEFKNSINVLCLEYGIEIPSIPVKLSKELELKEIGLSDDSIRKVMSYPVTEADTIRTFKQEKKIEEENLMIERYKELGVEVDDEGFLSGLADEIAREYGGASADTFIKIQSLSSDVLSEICRAYTSPIRIR